MTTPDRARSRLRPSLPQRHTDPWWTTFVPFWPWLATSATACLVLVFIIFNWSPAQIANVILPQAYLTFMVPLLVFLGGILVTLWRHPRRGIMTALAISLLVLLRLQQVVITWQFIGVIMISFVIIEGVSSYLDRPFANHHGQRQTHPTPPRRYY